MRKYTYQSSASPEISPREKSHFNRTRALAGECSVLLRNDGTLPLSSPQGCPNIALYGEGARNTVRGGTGSGMTITRKDYSLEEAMETAGYTVTTKDWLHRQDLRRKQEFDDFMARAMAESSGMGLSLMLMGGTPPAKEAEPVTDSDIEGSDTDTAVYVLVRNAGEGDDRRDEPGDFRLTESEKAAITRVASAYEKMVLVLNVCGPVATDDFTTIPGVNAILYVGQQGAPGGLSICDVLTGVQAPSGKLADTWPRIYTDCASAPNFGLQNDGMDDVYYEEGIYVGYRYFDTFNVTPGFPFGFGLSYTTFSTELQEVQADAQHVAVTVRVTNTGAREGKEVVQVYVSAPDGQLEKPCQELKGYGKTRLLAPGTSETLTITFKTASLASYSEADAAWILEAGDYVIRVGNSSRRTHIAARLRLDQTVVTEQLRNLFKDAEPKPDLSKAGVQPFTYAGETEEKASAPVICLFAKDFTTRVVSYPEPEELVDHHPDVLITAQDVLVGTYTVEELVAQLSVEEMAAFTTGNSHSLMDFMGSSSNFRIPGAAAQSTDICLDNRDLREWDCSDGPAGLHVDPEFVVYADGSVQSVPQEDNPRRPFDHSKDDQIVEHHYQPCTAFPTASTVAVSWNPEVLEEISDMYAIEMMEIGLETTLKPSMNIHRDPLGGRNFEYYSEDPLLSGTYAAADVLSLQRYPGITSTVKHFAVNNHDRNRMFSNSHASERALREIYLKNFEIVIRAAQPGCIMSSYNLINGKHAANNRDLLTYVCRNEWGYEGMIMTDWFMTEMEADVFSAVGNGRSVRYGKTIAHECTWAGNDMVMPGCDNDRADIIAHVKDGSVALADLQRCTVHVIRLILRSSLYEGAKPYRDIVPVEAPYVTVERK